MSLNLRSLIGKLNQTTRAGLEGAAGIAVTRTHYDVELEHWVRKLVDEGDSDVPRILRHFDIDPDRFIQNLDRVLDQTKTGSSRQAQLSPEIEKLAREAWVWSSVEYGLSQVRSGALLLAALSDDKLKRRLIAIHPDVNRINVESLTGEMLDIVSGSKEDREVSAISDGTQREMGASTLR